MLGPFTVGSLTISSAAVSQTTAARPRADACGRPLSAPGRGKSELRRAVRRVTPGQGDLKESGTENTPPNPGFPGGKGEKVR